MPPITEKDFGKKMTCREWAIFPSEYFIPLAFTSKGSVLGERSEGTGACYINAIDWLPYKEPKKKVIKRMAPALIERNEEIKDAFGLFETEREAINKIALLTWCEFIKWPASEAMFVEIEVEE